MNEDDDCYKGGLAVCPIGIREMLIRCSKVANIIQNTTASSDRQFLNPDRP